MKCQIYIFLITLYGGFVMFYFCLDVISAVPAEDSEVHRGAE
jgi:hypothetical protein